RIHSTGGPEVLRWEEVAVPSAGAGEVRLRQTAVGVNFIDVYYRTGLYPLPALPAALGMEAAGMIEEVGPGVEGLAAGDRVAYVVGPGAYCEERVLPAARVVKLPDEISEVTAAAMMLKGMTAEYLLRRTYRVRSGDTVLIHAAAGGVGLIACQWASHLGATVIGTVGSPKKAELARAHGCHHPILYRQTSFADEVKLLTGGRGVPVVYDSVGRDTFEESLRCLQPRGLLVLFGQSSGPVPSFELGRLAQLGSLYVTRPTLATYTASREDLEHSARALLAVVESGAVEVEVPQTYPLRDAEQAHRDLESRRTTGSTVLLP
ncbi:MAG TPA: quinone oxidoreductase, partial [Thermoanaerobaculia bacterium]|nr:quinone oxidoreductase [Thermoanaerobaculia bacterium]